MRTPVILVLALLAPAVLAQPYKVYVVAVSEAGDSWVSRDAFASFLASYLKQAGIQFTTITKMADWQRLMEDAPSNVLVIFAHGEVIPIPDKYGSNYTAYYQDLAALVRDKGWVLVAPIGLFTWLIGNERTVGYTNAVDGPSVSAFCRALSLPPINPWCDQSAQASELAQRVSAVLGISIPSTVGAARAIAVAPPAEPLWYLYKVPESVKTANFDNVTRPFYAMAAWKVGKGMLVWGGMSGGEESRKAAITAVAVAYILDPTLAQKQPPPPPLITPEKVYMYALIGAVIVAVALVPVIILKGRAKKA